MKFMLVIYIVSGLHTGDYIADSGLTREDCGNAITQGIASLNTDSGLIPVPESAILSCEPEGLP